MSDEEFHDAYHDEIVQFTAGRGWTQCNKCSFHSYEMSAKHENRPREHHVFKNSFFLISWAWPTSPKGDTFPPKSVWFRMPGARDPYFGISLSFIIYHYMRPCQGGQSDQSWGIIKLLSDNSCRPLQSWSTMQELPSRGEELVISRIQGSWR